MPLPPPLPPPLRHQTCTEWGFYQTCELGSRCPFTQGYNNLSKSVAMCQLLFRVDEQVRGDGVTLPDSTDSSYTE